MARQKTSRSGAWLFFLLTALILVVCAIVYVVSRRPFLGVQPVIEAPRLTPSPLPEPLPSPMPVPIGRTP